jgi:hypothetical protein
MHNACLVTFIIFTRNRITEWEETLAVRVVRFRTGRNMMDQS